MTWASNSLVFESGCYTGPLPALTLVNEQTEAATMTITSVDGSYRLELVVPAEGTMTARLSPRTVYEIDPGEVGVRAGLTLAGDGALAAISVWPADAASPAITVYP